MTRDQLSVPKAAQHFNVSTQTIQLWKKFTVRKSIPGRPAKITEVQILANIEKYPRLSVERAKCFFGESTHAVFNALYKAKLIKNKLLRVILFNCSITTEVIES